MADVEVRRGMPSTQLSKEEFARRLRGRFDDPAFDGLNAELEKIIDAAWDGYQHGRKSPRTRPAGPEFADPAYELSIEWLNTRDEIRKAARAHKDSASPSRVLIVNGSSRSDQTCPGERSKTYRLARMACELVAAEAGFEADFLDLSRLASEYGRTIHPCKACVSTAMPLCHWPCSCYPNHSLGQVNDWMAELYPRWVAAHGVMILCPVNWYQAPSVLKLMIDRLVCADGGNPDPTATRGKDPERAKQLELDGWPYPRHLAGRVFAVVVHGDADGVQTLRDNLSGWLTDMGLVSAGAMAELGRYGGYFRPYATSHDDLDRDPDMQEEVRNAARSLVRAVQLLRAGKFPRPDEGLRDPRPK